jgi:hypothetical protein
MYEQFARAERLQGEIRPREKAHLKRLIELIEAIEEIMRRAKANEAHMEH